MANHVLRDHFEKRRAAMGLELVSFKSHYKDLAMFLQPRRGRFFITDRNQGAKRHNNIINNVGTKALRTATAGMFAGTMSPSRPWFNITTINPDLAEFQPVKIWLWQVENILREIFNRGNLYNMIPTMLQELLLFATGCLEHVFDFEDVARFYAHTVGSYVIAQNDRYVIDTVVRHFEMAASQMVKEFGENNVSPPVKRAWDLGNYTSAFPVVHFVDPNPDFNQFRAASRFKKIRSVKYEPGHPDKDKFLSNSGFDQFPLYVPRWETTLGDVYGTNCPGMVVLGDIKGLQIKEKRKAQGIDKMVNPPLQGPASLKHVPVNSLPGGMNVLVSDPAAKLTTIYDTNPQLQDMNLDIEKDERRIEGGFFVDMFLAITNMEGIQPKNEMELLQRNAERLLQLGPVLEQLHGEVLDKLIDRTFTQALEAGLLPPPPPELRGQPLKVKYISSLAMAQRAVATGTIERMVGFIGGLVEVGYEDARDKFDADQAIDEVAAVTGLPPRTIRPDNIVAELRAQRAEALREEQEAQLALAQAQTAKALSEADTQGENALTQVQGE